MRTFRPHLCALFVVLLTPLSGQAVFTESFTGTTAPGWYFGGTGYTPNLTANSVDAPGDGWLRLTSNANNLSTYAFLDTQIFSVNAQINITMEYTFWNGSGADGITFFLIDGSVDAASFAAGAFGGSLGYAQKDAGAAPPSGVPGMAGGYLGFGFDNFGNYSNPTEGRVGGPGSVPNAIAVRGPESSDWAYIAGSGPLQDLPGGGQMDFPTHTTRPDQTGAEYRAFQLVLDANNQLTVFMKFGATGDFISVFTADLSAYDRPETFKLGFTGATGGSTEIHEIRNLIVETTPWSTGSGAYEWDNGAGNTTWGTTNGGEANNNWYSSIPGDNNKTPLRDSDVLFGNKPSSGPQTVNIANNVEVRNLTFDTAYNYTLQGAGTITMGDPGKPGLPSINVNNYNDANARHKINNNISVAEALRINNYSFSTLCLNGTLATNGNDITVNGYGAVNFNGDITGSGDLIKNGKGITTINNDNSDGTPWNGNVTINQGMVVVTEDGALGGSVNGTNNQNRSSGNTTIRLSDASAAAAGVKVGQIVTGTNIPAGTYVTGISSSGGNTTITLSQALTGSLSNGATVAFAGATTVNNGGTLAFRNGVSYSTSEWVTISGRGVERGPGQSAGAIYNDGGNNTFAGNITLAADAAIGSRDGNLTLTGNIGQSGSRSLTKVGDGVVTLSGTNTYTGGTVIEGGALRVTAAAALAGGSNLQLSGGVLEIAADLNGGTTGDFSRSLGGGGTEVRWTGDGGFSAFGGDRTVRLNNGTGNLTWANTANFIGTGSALLLSSNYSDSTITLANQISFNSAQREIRVADGSAAVDAVLSGRLRGGNDGTGTGGLIKTGEGTLSLTAGNNDYSGATEIRAGALRGNTGANSNIQLSGGVRELNADYTGNLGAGGGALRWISGGGGLAADTAARTFNVGNNNQTLIWGGTTGNSQYFVRSGDELVLGSRSTSATLTFANAIDLNGGTRTLRVIDGVSSFDGAEAVISRAIGNGALNVTGTGRLDLTADNTYTGATTVAGAELRLSGNGDIAQSSGITVRQGGTLTLDNSGTNLGNRINNGVTLSGGTLNFLGFAGATSETAGLLTLASGSGNTVNVQRSGSNSSQLTFSNLAREAGSTVNFTNAAGGGTFGNTSNNPRVVLTARPALDPGNIYAFATINDTNFVGSSGASNGRLITVAAGTANINAAANIVGLSSGTTNMTANRTHNALRLLDNNNTTDSNLNLGGFTLTLNSGALISSRDGLNRTHATNTISNGTLITAGNRDLITHVTRESSLNISATIGTAGYKNFGLTKAGDGTLTLSGSTANTFTGTTYVNGGTLSLAKDAGVTAIAGDLVVGDGSGVDTVSFINNEQLANTSNVTLRGGLTGAAASATNVAVLDLKGTTQTFDGLTVVGNSVIDFSGGDPCAPTFLNINSLTFVDDATLTIRNWIEFTDFLLIADTATVDFSRITFEGYGGQASWQDYSTGWKQITPVPEPSTYGAVFLGGAAAFLLLRRRRA